jgi:hypothetical protein
MVGQHTSLVELPSASLSPMAPLSSSSDNQQLYALPSMTSGSLLAFFPIARTAPPAFAPASSLLHAPSAMAHGLCSSINVVVGSISSTGRRLPGPRASTRPGRPAILQLARAPSSSPWRALLRPASDHLSFLEAMVRGGLAWALDTPMVGIRPPCSPQIRALLVFSCFVQQKLPWALEMPSSRRSPGPHLRLHGRRSSLAPLRQFGLRSRGAELHPPRVRLGHRPLTRAQPHYGHASSSTGAPTSL